MPQIRNERHTEIEDQLHALASDYFFQTGRVHVTNGKRSFVAYRIKDHKIHTCYGPVKVVDQLFIDDRPSIITVEV